MATASFGGMGLAFRYPAAWRSGTFSDDVSSFTASIPGLTQQEAEIASMLNSVRIAKGD